MNLGEAWRVIGVPPTDDHRRVREAFIALVAANHPDRSRNVSAHTVTAQLTEAYRIVTRHLERPHPVQPDHADDVQAEATASGPAPTAQPLAAQVRVTGSDTITIDGPADLVTSIIVDACHRFGDLLIVDTSAGLVQIAVEFVDGPTCHVLLDLQGRAHDGSTDVFVTVDSLEQRPAPRLAAVTALIAADLAASAGPRG